MPGKKSVAVPKWMREQLAREHGVKKIKKSGRAVHYKPAAEVGITQQTVRDMAVPKQPSAFGSIIKSGGRALGGLFGPTGASVGGYIADKLSKLLGQGDYRVSDVEGLTKNSVAKPDYGDATHMKYNKDGTIRIRHREFIQDITGSIAFNNEAYAINPGNTRTFPYLYRIAQQFQTYQMEGLCFEFVSTSADALNSTNTALGAVIMGIQYDSLDQRFANKQQAENTQGTISGKPSSNMVMCVECRPGENPLTDLYIVRPGQSPQSDIRFQNLGNFQLMTVGMQAAAVIGELWISYDIILKKPILGSASASGVASHIILDNTTTDSASTSLFFGTNPQFAVNGLNISVNPVTKVITIPVTGLAGIPGLPIIVVDYFVTGTLGITALRYMDVILTNAVPYNAYTYDNVPASQPILSTSGSVGVGFSQKIAFQVVDPLTEVTVAFSGPAIFPDNGVVALSGDCFVYVFET